jgi:hypothetical protein
MDRSPVRSVRGHLTQRIIALRHELPDDGHMSNAIDKTTTIVRPRLIDHIALMRRLWTDDEGALSGDYCSVESTRRS